MKVTVQQQQLAQGLGIVSRAVANRSTLPVLSNILVATDEGRLRLSATNLELGISCWVPAQVKEEGSITLPNRTFVDLVNALLPEALELSLNARTQTVTVNSMTNTTDIKGIDAQEFPPMPVADHNDGLAFKAKDFKKIISQVVFAASTDDARPVLQGVLFEVNGTELTLAATDGFRVSVRKAQLEKEAAAPIKVIIPGRALAELSRIIPESDDTLIMNLPASRGQVIFRLPNVEVVSQLIDGTFPDYKSILPRSSKTKTVVSTSGLLKACKQTEIFARDNHNVVRMNIVAQGEEPGVVEVNAQSEETGTGDSKLEASIDGTSLLIAFNVRFLIDVLNVVDTPSVMLETNQANSQAVLRPMGDDDFIHVLMPMHLG